MANHPVQNLTIAASQSSPSVMADWECGVITMRGESYPENSFSLYEKILEWLASYLKLTSRSLQLDLELNYLNTSSVRAMIELFDNLQAAGEDGRDVSVIWRYDTRNPRAAELGKELSEDYTFPFTILATDP